MIHPSFDGDGYPTDETLKVIREWDYNDFAGFVQYLSEAWRYPEYFRVEVETDGDSALIINASTGGWSGNEDIIGALRDNVMFWALCWEQSRRGGHYIFRVKK